MKLIEDDVVINLGAARIVEFDRGEQRLYVRDSWDLSDDSERICIPLGDRAAEVWERYKQGAFDPGIMLS